ncbi:MAG TPA: hypothetical protein VF331_07325 [Polyangiales bacterium]
MSDFDPIFDAAFGRLNAAKHARYEAGVKAGSIGVGGRDEALAKFEAAKADERSAEIDLFAVMMTEYRRGAADRLAAEKAAAEREESTSKRTEGERETARIEMKAEREWQRKHSESMLRSQNAMMWLTGAIVFASLIQAGAGVAAFFRHDPPPSITVHSPAVNVYPPGITVTPAPVTITPSAAPTSNPTPQSLSPGSMRSGRRSTTRDP